MKKVRELLKGLGNMGRELSNMRQEFGERPTLAQLRQEEERIKAETSPVRHNPRKDWRFELYPLENSLLVDFFTEAREKKGELSPNFSILVDDRKVDIWGLGHLLTPENQVHFRRSAGGSSIPNGRHSPRSFGRIPTARSFIRKLTSRSMRTIQTSFSWCFGGSHSKSASTTLPRRLT